MDLTFRCYICEHEEQIDENVAFPEPRKCPNCGLDTLSYTGAEDSDQPEATMIDLKKLKELKEKATGGEWEAIGDEEYNYFIQAPKKIVAHDTDATHAEYIALLHNSADALLAIVEQAEKVVMVKERMDIASGASSAFNASYDYQIELDKLCQIVREG